MSTAGRLQHRDDLWYQQSVAEHIGAACLPRLMCPFSRCCPLGFQPSGEQVPYAFPAEGSQHAGVAVALQAESPDCTCVWQGQTCVFT